MSTLVAGGAGFIGKSLVQHFLDQGEKVLVLDNFCRGKREFLASLAPQKALTVLDCDLAQTEHTLRLVGDYHGKNPISAVWHLAANSDIPAGIADASVDLRDTFLTTYSLLLAMKTHGIKRLAFASSSAIYGEHQQTLHENLGPLLPISNYGAMKLASEAAISAAVESHLERAYLFRFPNVVGIPATHGVIVDFVRKLKATPQSLAVLGNGTQQKAYLHVSELLAAMLFIADKAADRLNCYNIGPADDGVSVRTIAETVCARVSPQAQIVFGQGDRGWVGDVPRFRYSVDKLAALGWQPKLSSAQAIARAVDEIASQEDA
jgi:UDP-glucose 4-epimerase